MVHSYRTIRRIGYGTSFTRLRHIHMLQWGARWRDCPREYGPYTNVYNRFNRCAKHGRWCAIFEAPAKPGKDAVALSLDPTSKACDSTQRVAGGKPRKSWREGTTQTLRSLEIHADASGRRDKPSIGPPADSC